MQVQTYLFFGGRCEEAIKFYGSILKVETTMLMRFKDSPDQSMITPESKDKVMHASLRIGDSTVLVSDGDGKPAHFAGFALSLDFDSAAEAKRVFHALAEGGQVRMPLAETFF